MKIRYSDFSCEAALDEVGRGCLAGPVVAAAVILPNDFFSPLINDSKKLSEKKRIESEVIIKNNALDYAIAEVSPEEIDKINILNASFLAMHRALDKLIEKPDFLLVDGNRFKKYGEIPFFCAVKGDANYINIAAASILAKNYRDKLMAELDKEYPEYQWEKNKGYPTLEHRHAIIENGITPYHRKSFKLLPTQLFLDL